MTNGVNPSTTQSVKIVEYLNKEQPLLIAEAYKQVEKPEPYYHFINTMTPIFIKFCECQKIDAETLKGKHIGKQAGHHRILFIAIILWFYSPGVFNTKVKYNVEDLIRKELFGILLCNEEWISQQVDTIRTYYKMNYDQFKVQVNTILSFIKDEVKERVPTEEENKNLGLFE